MTGSWALIYYIEAATATGTAAATAVVYFSSQKAAQNAASVLEHRWGDNVSCVIVPTNEGLA